MRDPWSEPAVLDRLTPFVGSVWTPSLAADGLELYFSDGMLNAPNPGGYGGSDIWVMRRGDRTASWWEPVNLGLTINTHDDEDTPCISADGLELYFVRNTPDHPQNSELMVAKRSTKDEPWGAPVNLGSKVNSNQYEWTPWIAPDGLSLFFSRGFSKGHIHVSRRARTVDPWEWPQFFAPVSSGSADDVWDSSPGQSEYSLSFAGGDPWLYFSRATTPFASDWDIWQVEVMPVLDFDADDQVDSTDLTMLIENWGTHNRLYDVGPPPLGDGVVDELDLKVLMESLMTPGPDAQDVPRAVVLSWAAPSVADSQDVYFGTSLEAVSNAGRTDPRDVLVSLGQQETAYAPESPLEFSQTYYWRVDFVVDAPTRTVYQGPVLGFTTEAVAPRQRLSVGHANGNAVLSWPLAASQGLVLEATPSLKGTWTPVTTPPVVEGDQYELAVPIAGHSAYFRLHSPNP